MNERVDNITSTPPPEKAVQAPLDKTIIGITSVVLLGMVAVSFLFSGETNALLNKSLQIFGAKTGIFYMIGNVAVLGLVFYFALSKWGHLKFGAPDEKPEFSLISWGAMMFCTCIGGAALYWASLEPLMHLKEVPFSSVEPMSTDSYKWSMTFMLFRPWLIWQWYVLPTLPLCYLLYIKKKETMRFSELMEPIVGKKVAHGWVGTTIEIIFVLSVILCYAGVFAVSTPLCGAALSAVLGIAHTMMVDVIVLIFCTMLFMWSSYVGLKRGIRFLSLINVYLAIGFCAYILLVGPSMFILESSAFAFGNLLDNFFTLMLGKDPYWQSNFATDWTQFIILWQIAAAPMMALFTARISRGRTIREILMWGIIFGIFGQYMVFTTFGNLSLWIQHTGLMDLVGIMETESNAAALVAIFSALPFTKLMLVICIIFMTIFTATCIDSASYVLACSCSKHIKPGMEPHVVNRLYWAVLQAVIAIAFIFVGSLTATRVMGSYAGVLMLIPMGFAFATWYKYCREYKEEHRALRQPLSF